MFLKLPKHSLVLLLSLGVLGCGTMNNPSSLPDVPDEVSSLATSFRVYERSLPSLPKQSSPIPKQEETKDCTNGGTMHYTSDFNLTHFNDANFTLNLTQNAQNCSEDGVIVDGEMHVKVVSVDGKQTSTSRFSSDFSISDGKYQVLMKKGSIVVSETLDDYTQLVTSNAEIVAGESRQKTIDFKTKEFEKNGITMVSNISGKKIVDNKTFIVDETFDHNATPMVYDREGRLQIGGLQRYLNAQNQTIMMEAVGIDKMKVSMDVDGDGKADNAETVNVSVPF